MRRLLFTSKTQAAEAMHPRVFSSFFDAVLAHISRAYLVWKRLVPAAPIERNAKSCLILPFSESPPLVEAG